MSIIDLVYAGNKVFIIIFFTWIWRLDLMFYSIWIWVPRQSILFSLSTVAQRNVEKPPFCLSHDPPMSVFAHTWKNSNGPPFKMNKAASLSTAFVGRTTCSCLAYTFSPLPYNNCLNLICLTGKVEWNICGWFTYRMRPCMLSWRLYGPARFSVSLLLLMNMRDFIFALGFLQAHMVHGEWLDFEKRL